MVKSAFGTACQRLRRSPLCEGGDRRSTRLDGARLFLVAIRAWALIAAAAGACLADHADSVSAAPALVHGSHDEPSPVEAAKARAAEVVAAPPVALSPAT